MNTHFGFVATSQLPSAVHSPVRSRRLTSFRSSNDCWRSSCDEICLADTIGVATPASVDTMVKAVLGSVGADRLGLHFHDTSGRALENVEVALHRDIHIFDSAAGGLGGCPFAPGAPGNLATEKLVQYLHHVGLNTGVELDAVAAASAMIAPYVSRELAAQT